MKTYFQLLICIVISVLANSCNDGIETQEICFIGDSLVARWDLQESFPSNIVYNYGKSGAHIDLISDYKGKFSGKTVVVLIGTNDLSSMSNDQLADFCQRYILAVKELGAAHTYILSVPPRNFKGDSPSLNDIIISFNSIIRSKADDHPSFTYVDIHPALCRDGSINPEYSFDGLHLNIYGYQIVARLLTKSMN